MKPLRESPGVVVWAQVDFHDNYELQLGEDVYGALRTYPSRRGLAAQAAAVEGRWIFQPAAGFWKRRTDVFTPDSLPVASYSQGTLAIEGGHSYSFARLTKPLIHWAFADSAGSKTLRFGTRNDEATIGAFVGRLDFNPACMELPELSLLALFCGYLVVRKEGAPELHLQDYEKKLGITELGGNYL